MAPGPAPQPLPLRERKKQRTRRDLTETALRLFIEHGYDATTLDELTDAAEVSKRTFFRFFPSKEAVALAAETELWDAYLAEVGRREISGPVLDSLRASLTSTLSAMGDDWLRRFLATRGLIARTPALRDRSDLATLDAQHRLSGVLQASLGPGARARHRAALISEITFGAWRCAARNWISGTKQPSQPRKVTGLIRDVDTAFADIPAAIALTAPTDA